jgi:hypothetical protein
MKIRSTFLEMLNIFRRKARAILFGAPQGRKQTQRVTTVGQDITETGIGIGLRT